VGPRIIQEIMFINTRPQNLTDNLIYCTANVIQSGLSKASKYNSSVIHLTEVIPLVLGEETWVFSITR
jgi:hypothetical protein